MGSRYALRWPKYSLAFLFVQDKYSLTLVLEDLWLALHYWYSSFFFFFFIRTTLVFFWLSFLLLLLIGLIVFLAEVFFFLDSFSRSLLPMSNCQPCNKVVYQQPNFRLKFNTNFIYTLLSLAFTYILDWIWLIEVFFK